MSKTSKKLSVLLLWVLLCASASAQVENHAIAIPIDSLKGVDSQQACRVANGSNELDVIDAVRMGLHKETCWRSDTGDTKSKKLRVSVVPAAGYTLQTDFAGILAGNGVFYTNPDANASTIITSFTYTENNQVILPVQTTLWTKGNKYDIVFDWRYLYFPSYTYGLGMFTTLSNGYLIDYSTIHLHQAVLKKIHKDMYAGVGYNYDYYWNIKELNPPPNKVTDFENYGFQSTEFASGLTLNYLYDNRDNPINAYKGNFVNVIYRTNLAIFGNNEEWRSLVIDLRKYIPLPLPFLFGSKNTLAFWSYEWLTVSGKPPYMMLPNTGGDPYSNTGRGYIQGRYRGPDMLYLEGEYRFALTRSGILGGVVFANAESFTEYTSNKFQGIAPAYGAGIRLKFNKFSRTNVALDYGIGTGGSAGFFVNVGEVF